MFQSLAVIFFFVALALAQGPFFDTPEGNVYVYYGNYSTGPVFDFYIDEYNATTRQGYSYLYIDDGVSDAFDSFGYFSVNNTYSIYFNVQVEGNIWYFWYEEEAFYIEGIMEVNTEVQHVYFDYRITFANGGDAPISFGGNMGWDGCGWGKIVTPEGVLITHEGLFDPLNLPEWFASRPDDYLSDRPLAADEYCDSDDAVGFAIYNTDLTWKWVDYDYTPLNFSSCFYDYGNNYTELCTDGVFIFNTLSVSAGDVVDVAFGISTEYYNRNLTGPGSIGERTEEGFTLYYETRGSELRALAADFFGWSCDAGTYGAECMACDCGEAICSEGILGDGSCSCEEGSWGADCTACDCNDGTCADSIDGDGSCTCPELTFGADCSGVCNCLNGGTCADGADGNGKCTCVEGFSGDDCGIEMTTEATEDTQGTESNSTDVSSSESEGTEGTSESDDNSMATTLLVGSFVTLVLSL